MRINSTPAAEHALVNLAEVRREHLPTPLVQFSPLAEVRRRANEVSRQHPRLREEAAFVLRDEAARRAKLAGYPLTLTH